MKSQEVRRIRGFYHAMLGVQQTLAAIPTKQPGMVVDQSTYGMVRDEVEQIASTLPNLLPKFERVAFLSHDVGRGAYYHLDALKLYVGRAVGRLKAAIDEQESNPVTQEREFTYVSDPALRGMIVRDYAEAQRAFIANCWKASIILSGGLLEAVLLDLVAQHEMSATSSRKAPKKPGSLQHWPLSTLIDVAVDLELVTPGIEKLSHPIREYRNLVHPGVELRSGLTFGEEEARIALEVLHILDRDLS
jgi:hypothetical protein